MTPMRADRDKRVALACGCEKRNVRPTCGTTIVTCRICHTTTTITVRPHTRIAGFLMASVAPTPSLFRSTVRSHT